jgi:hypothetical protein
MPGCVLRVSGEHFNAQKAFASSSLRPVSTRNNRAAINVSSRDGDEFREQIEDAILFLETGAEAIRSLAASPGIDELSLDFGVWLHTSAAQFFCFPKELALAAGSLGIALKISIYAAEPSS